MCGFILFFPLEFSDSPISLESLPDGLLQNLQMKLYPSWTPSCILGYIPIYSPATHYINKHKPLLGYIGMFKRDIPCISGCISYVIPNWNSSLPGPVPAETLILVPRGHGCSSSSSTALRGTAGHCRLAGGEGQGYLQLSPGECLAGWFSGKLQTSDGY